MSATSLRRAAPDDIAAIVELNRTGNGDDIAVEMQVVFDHGGMAARDYAVAVVEGQVVATVGLLCASLQTGRVTLRVGQPEYIATDPAHQGHGLARRLLDLVHGWSAERGDLLQLILGVPYFYRQYGYSYGLVRPPTLSVLPEQPIEMPDGWEVRRAHAGDLPRIRALQEMVQVPVDVALPFTDNLWPSFLAMEAAPLLVAVQDGHVRAIARLRLAPGEAVRVQAMAADSPDGLLALLAGTKSRHPGTTLVVAERQGSFLRSVVGAAGWAAVRRDWAYVRVPSLAAVLSAMIPVLDDRLARSPFASWSGGLNISLYRSGVQLAVEEGRVAGVSPVAGVHEPDDDNQAVGIPPDLVPKLLFGEAGVLGLEDHPDVYLGRSRPIMAALFPPLRVDLLTW